MLEVIIRTRPLEDGINSAMDQLDAVNDPDGRFQIAIRLALRLSRSGIAEGASRVLAVARSTAFIHDAGRNVESLANKLACQIWDGELVDQILTRAMSVTWVRTGIDEEKQELPKHEQHRLNAQVVEIVAMETLRAGRAEELREAIEKGPEEYRPAALLGAMRIGDCDWDLVKELTDTMFSEAHLSSDQIIQIATAVCKRIGLPDLAVKMQNPSKDFDVPDLIGGTLPDTKPKIQSFLIELEFRLRLGADTTPQFPIWKTVLGHLGDFSASMSFTPFLDARDQIRELTAGLLVSAFTADTDLGRCFRRFYSRRGSSCSYPPLEYWLHQEDKSTNRPSVRLK